MWAEILGVRLALQISLCWWQRAVGYCWGTKQTLNREQPVNHNKGPSDYVIPHRIAKYWKALIVIIQPASCPERNQEFACLVLRVTNLSSSSLPIFVTILHPTFKYSVIPHVVAKKAYPAFYQPHVGPSVTVILPPIFQIWVFLGNSV